MKNIEDCNSFWVPDRIIADTTVYVALFHNPDVIGGPLKSLVASSYNYELFLLTHVIRELKKIPIKHPKIYRRMLNNITLDRLLFMVSSFFANNIYDAPKSFQVEQDIIKALNDPGDIPIIKGMLGPGADLLFTTDNDFQRILHFVDF